MKKRILIIDDEKGFTSMLSMTLESTGAYEVWTENDPESALETAIECQPNVILLDVIMPKMEGPDVAYQVRSHAVLSCTPIIFLTATITQQEVESQDGLIAGNQFIAKPSRLVHLIDSIERALVS